VRKTPSANQTIQPASDIVPLRINRVSGASNLFEVYDEGTAAWIVDQDGNLIPAASKKIGDAINGLTVQGNLKIAGGDIVTTGQRVEISSHMYVDGNLQVTGQTTITGGTINNTAIGNTARASGKFIDIMATYGVESSTLTLSNAGTALNSSGDINVASGKKYRVNGIQLALSNLSDGTTVFVTRPATTQEVAYQGNAVQTSLKMAASPTAAPLVIKTAADTALFTVTQSGVMSSSGIYTVGASTFANNVFFNSGVQLSWAGESNTNLRRADSGKIKTDGDFEAKNVYGTAYYKNGRPFDEVYLTSYTAPGSYQSIIGQKIVTKEPGIGSTQASFMVYPGFEADLAGDANDNWNLFRVGVGVSGAGSGERFKIAVSSVIISKANLLINTPGKKLLFSDGGTGVADLYYDAGNSRLKTSNNFEAAGMFGVAYYKNGKSFDEVYLTSYTAPGLYQSIIGQKIVTKEPGIGAYQASFMIYPGFDADIAGAADANWNLFKVGVGVAGAGSGERFKVAVSSVVISNANLLINNAGKKLLFADGSSGTADLYYDTGSSRLKTGSDFEADKVYGQSYYKGAQLFDDVYVTTGTGTLGASQEISGCKKVTCIPGTTDSQPSFQIFPDLGAVNINPLHNIFSVSIAGDTGAGQYPGERFKVSASSIIISKANLLINTAGKKLQFSDGSGVAAELYYDTIIPG
jgi:hypothetical protein